MISVCMATYNGENYIEEQLNSILSQLHDDDEVILSDDGSIDNTINIVQKIGDSRIKVIENENNHGYTGNFYNALKNARGDIIFLADQDDVWLPNKVDVCLGALKEYDFVVSDATEVDERLKVINSSRIKKYNIRQGFWFSLIRCRYIGCCMAFRRNVLDVIFPVPTYSNEFPHDLWITLVAERYFRAVLIEVPLILYRRHGNNASNGGDAESGRKLFTKVSSKFWYLLEVEKIRNRVSKKKGRYYE